jgi:hypothetical protein
MDSSLKMKLRNMGYATAKRDAKGLSQSPGWTPKSKRGRLQVKELDTE